MKGFRKIAFGFVALIFLAAGFAACIRWPSGLVAFPAYATAVCTVTGAVIVGNVGEHAVTRTKEMEP